VLKLVDSDSVFERVDLPVEPVGRFNSVETRCSCPYSGRGDCKHVVAVLLEINPNPPADSSETIETVLDDVPADELRAFVREAVGTEPPINNEQFWRAVDSLEERYDYQQS